MAEKLKIISMLNLELCNGIRKRSSHKQSYRKVLKVFFSLPLDRTEEHLIVVLFLPISKGWIVNDQSVMIVLENMTKDMII